MLPLGKREGWIRGRLQTVFVCNRSRRVPRRPIVATIARLEIAIILISICAYSAGASALFFLQQPIPQLSLCDRGHNCRAKGLCHWVRQRTDPHLQCDYNGEDSTAPERRDMKNTLADWPSPSPHKTTRVLNIDISNQATQAAATP